MREETREYLNPEVIFDTESCMVIQKPSGWVVNDASTVTHTRVIQDWVSQNFTFEIAQDKDRRNGIVHRLDKETSGALIIAKTAHSFEALQAQFKERKVKKTYVALCHGVPKEHEGNIDQKIGRLPWRRDRFGVYQGGRDSLTHFQVKEIFESDKHQKYSLVEFKPVTGRTHQIRVHAKYIGIPLVSDDFYAGRKTSRKDRIWCPRLFLHAQSIEFLDPDTGEKIRVKAPLPTDLSEALTKI